MANFIFLDNNSSTPLDPLIREKYLEALDNTTGNPSSNHQAGWLSSSYLNEGREKIAAALSTTPDCIVLTSGATESNNLVINGFYKKNPDSQFITSKIEHSSVIEPILNLEKEFNLNAKYLSVDTKGKILLDSDIFSSYQNTLTSIQHSNNEIGTIQEINKIKHLIAGDNFILHSDISQSLGKISCSFKDLDCDVLTLSSHKIHSPIGIGALAFRSKKVMSYFTSIFKGGAHEFNLRPGTELSALSYAFGNACELAVNNLESYKIKITNLTKLFYENLKTNIPDISLIGEEKIENRLPGNLNISFKGIKGKDLATGLSSLVCCSTGSACLSSLDKSSHVLEALPISEEKKDSCVRFGISRLNTEEEIVNSIKIITEKYLKVLNRK